MRPKRRNRTSDSASLVGTGLAPGGLGTGEAGRRPLYHCNFCARDLSLIPRIKCAECADFDLCVECFCAGVEVNAPQHRRNHSYRVVESLRFPILTPEWTADEEILLLEAIELYGLFNWSEVAEHVGTKSALAARDHYMNFYLKSSTAPLPNTLAGPLAQAAESKDDVVMKEEDSAKKEETQGKELKRKDVEQQEEKVARDDEHKPEELKSKAGEKGKDQDEKKAAKKEAPSADANKETSGNEAPETAEQEQEHPTKGTQKNGKKKAPGSDEKVPKRDRENVSRKAVATAQSAVTLIDVIGYCPQRDEFDPDYDMDAEIPLADLEFAEGDDAVDENEEKKLMLLDIYYRRIMERQRRREFLVSKGLADIKKQMSAASNRRKEDPNSSAPLRVFDQIADKAGVDMEELVGLVMEERNLRSKIAWLSELRAAGVKTMNEANVYAADKRRRLGRKSGV